MAAAEAAPTFRAFEEVEHPLAMDTTPATTEATTMAVDQLSEKHQRLQQRQQWRRTEFSWRR